MDDTPQDEIEWTIEEEEEEEEEAFQRLKDNPPKILYFLDFGPLDD